MPTYQYRCTACNDEFEIIQSMTDPSLDSCNKCDGQIIRIIGSNIGIQFKGSGFYSTDNNNTEKK